MNYEDFSPEVQKTIEELRKDVLASKDFYALWSYMASRPNSSTYTQKCLIAGFLKGKGIDAKTSLDASKLIVKQKWFLDAMSQSFARFAELIQADRARQKNE